MGLFDGKVKELGDTLAKAFEERAKQLEEEYSNEKDPGRSLILKTTYASLKEVSSVIKNALASE